MNKAAPAILLADRMPCSVQAAKPVKSSGLTAPDPQLIALVQEATDESPDFQDDYDQQVWLSSMSLRMVDLMPDPLQRTTLLILVHKEASRAKVPPQLVLALIQVESKFDAYAVSHSGAVGLMQIMPFWLKLIGHEHDSLVHAQTNLRMGCTILKYYLERSHGDIREALQRYNGATVGIDYSDSVLKALSNRWYLQ